MSFTFYVLSRFKYCLLLVKNSIANRNFPGWRARADEGHSLKHFLPWEENLEGCCLSNLYQAQQVIRCLCCKSAMIPIPQAYVVTMVEPAPKASKSKALRGVYFLPNGLSRYRHCKSCTEQQGSRKGAWQRWTSHILRTVDFPVWRRRKKCNLQVEKHTLQLVF